MEEIDGVTAIETDIPNRTCQFTVTNPGVDYQARLAELAQNNEHLADYEIQ